MIKATYKKYHHPFLVWLSISLMSFMAALLGSGGCSLLTVKPVPPGDSHPGGPIPEEDRPPTWMTEAGAALGVAVAAVGYGYYLSRKKDAAKS